MPLLAQTQGAAMPLHGVDVASYQGRPDWRRVYGSGIRFGFSKVTESTNYTNPTWSHNKAGMAALGGDFLPGAYHFLHGGDGAAQARYFHAKAGNLAGCAVALDVEASGADAATARAWVAEYKRLTGGHPVIGYYPRWYWQQTGRPDLSFFDSIWQSHYVKGSGAPTALYRRVPGSWWEPFGGERISILQYASSATVPGIAGRCDINAYVGTAAELRALALGGKTTAPPTQEDDDTMKIKLNVETSKLLTVPAGERVSVGLDAEKYDVGWHNGAQAAWFPKEHAYYQATAEVALSGAGGPVRLAIGQYESDSNARLEDVLTDDKTAAVGKSTVTLSGLVWMSKDYKYRLDIENLSGAPINVTGAAVRIAH